MHESREREDNEVSKLYGDVVFFAVNHVLKKQEKWGGAGVCVDIFKLLLFSGSSGLDKVLYCHCHKLQKKVIRKRKVKRKE